MANERQTLGGISNLNFGVFKPNAFNHEAYRQQLQIIDTKHDQALANKSKLIETISSADLNESEDEYKANLVNTVNDEFQKNVDENSGYAGNALTRSIQLADEIINSPGFKGRLRNQIEYKKAIEGIKNRKDLTQDEIDYALSMTKYNGVDKKEGETDSSAFENRELEKQGIVTPTSNNKVVGFTKWQNTVNVPTRIDPYEYMSSVVKGLPHQYGAKNEQIYYYYGKDEYGNDKYGTDASRSKDDLWYYSKTSGGYEQLTEKAIKDALTHAYENGTAADSSLRFQHDAAVWKNRNNIDKNEHSTNFGIALNYDEYKERIIDNFAKDHSLYKPGEVSYSELTGMKALAAAGRPSSKKSASGVDSDINSAFAHSQHSGFYQESINTAFANLGEKLLNEKLFTDLANNIEGINLIGTESSDEIYNLLKSQNKLTPEIIKQYQKVKHFEDLYEQEVSNLPDNSDEKAAIEFKALLDSGIDVTNKKYENNKFVKDYIRRCKEAFKNSKGETVDKIYFNIQDKFVDLILTELEDTYGDLSDNFGIDFEQVDNHTYMTLSKNNAQNLYFVQNIANRVNKKTPLFDNAFLPANAVNRLNEQYLEGAVGIINYKDPNTGKIYGMGTGNYTNIFTNDIEDPYNNAAKLLEKSTSGALKRNIQIPLITTTHNSAMESYARANGFTEGQIKDAANITPEGLKMMCSAENSMYVGYEGLGTSLPIENTEDKVSVTEYLRMLLSGNESKNRVSIGQGKLGGTVVKIARSNKDKINTRILTVGNDETGKKELYSSDDMYVYLPNFQANSIQEALDNRPGVKEEKELLKNSIAGHRTPINNRTQYLDAVDQSGSTYAIFNKNNLNVPIELLRSDQAGKYLELDRYINDQNIIYNTSIDKQNEIENNQFVGQQCAEIAARLCSIYGIYKEDGNYEMNVSNWPDSYRAKFLKLKDQLIKNL